MRHLRPSSLSRTLALAAPTVALVVQNSQAAFDSFIKIGSIKGESTDKTHAEWCTLTSFSFGAEKPYSSQGGASSPAKAKPLVITRNIDKASPELFLASVKGTALPTVTLELSKSVSSGSAPQVFYKLVLSDVIISSVLTDGKTTNDLPTETLTLNYQKVSIVYTPLTGKTAGTPQPEVVWDFAEINQ